MRGLLCLSVALLGLAIQTDAQVSSETASQPLSAIDWLTEQAALPSVAAPVVAPPVSGEITATPLDVAPGEGRGVIDQSMASPLGEGLWISSETSALAAALQDVSLELPAPAQNLLYRLLLTVAPAHETEVWLQARATRLLALGAVPQAVALFEGHEISSPDLFDVWLEAALLAGREDEACAWLRKRPNLSTDARLRIYCFARLGDWVGAALTLQTADSLGDLTDDDALLLSAYLDPELANLLPQQPPSTRATALETRLWEAIGEPLPVSRLPLRFAWRDLEPDSGWQTQINAAERLAQTGAIPSSQLFDIMTSRVPSASGAPWDSAAAYRALRIAIETGEADKVSDALPDAWKSAKKSGYGAGFARYFAPTLAELSLSGAGREAYAELGYLGEDPEKHALSIGALKPTFARIALGDIPAPRDSDAFLESLALGLGTRDMDAQLTGFTERGKLGEAILMALEWIGAGMEGDLGKLTQGLAGLRGLGFDSVARDTALALLVLQ
ncbi:MAG: hypothetical protein AAF330_01515 [Pseudomonadota bacterium]